MRFLGSLPRPSATPPDQLTPDHLDAFHAHRDRTAPTVALREVGEARMLFTSSALRDQVSAEVLDRIQRRLPAPRDAEDLSGTGTKRVTTGFSDGELARLLAALRADTARVRDRIRAGEDLVPGGARPRLQAAGRALDAPSAKAGGIFGSGAQGPAAAGKVDSV